jgi:biopolymer transport protein ExbD
MKVQADSEPYDTINVTPMLDLAYVLLVVFILLTTASVQGLNVSMPKPSNKPSTEQHEIKIVQITPEGRLLVNGVAVSTAELEAQLIAGKARDAQMSVLIKGDARAQYQSVIAVIDLCNALQVNMGLVTGRLGT